MSEFDDVLAQYGVKGMHWGVITKRVKTAYTKARTEDTTPVPVSITAKPGKKIKTEGGKNLPTSEDAKIAAIAKQKAKNTGLQSLSNDELRTLVDRIGLEDRYSKMSPQEITLGVKMAKMIVNSPAPDLAMLAVKVKSEKDALLNPDDKQAQAKVQLGLTVAQTILTSARQNTKTKKK